MARRVASSKLMNAIAPRLPALIGGSSGDVAGLASIVGDRGDVHAVDRFGASVPGSVMLRRHGFSVDNVCARALALLR